MPPKCLKCGFFHSDREECKRPRRSLSEELNFMVIKKGDEAYRFFFDTFHDASNRAKELTMQGNGSFLVYELVETHKRVQPEPVHEVYSRK